MTILERRTVRGLTIAMLALVLASCGTFDVQLEPDSPAAADVASDNETPTRQQDRATPTLPDPTATDEVSTDQPPTPASTAALPAPLPETPSRLWATYRDADYGYGYAYPCYWTNGPGTIRSYDDMFAMEHSVRGQWIDNQPPTGVVKVETGVLDYSEYGLEQETPLGEAITVAAGDPYGDGLPAFQSIEETTIAGKPVQRVYLGEQQDSWGGDFQRETYYFPVEAGRWFRFFVLPSEAIQNSSVQAILESLALSADEQIIVPSHDPDPPVEGRGYHVNDEAGFCFAYPAEFELDTYDAGVDSLGPTASLLLERPQYTVGLTASARSIGAGGSLEEAVTGFLGSFSDEAATGIERNPMELVAGVDYRLGGEPAEVLDGVPGTQVSLDIFATHGNNLYHLVFIPSPFDNPQASADFWLLYNSVTSTLSFLP